MDIETYYDTFEKLSLFYISRNRAAILIDTNYFTKNIGTFGGAITINAPNWSYGKFPLVYIQGNIFQGNTAYISGNSIYVRLVKGSGPTNYCGGVVI